MASLGVVRERDDAEVPDMLTLALTGGRGHAVLLLLLPYATVGRGKKARTRSRPPRAQTAQRAQRVGPSCQQAREKRWSLICKASKEKLKKQLLSRDPSTSPRGPHFFFFPDLCVFCVLPSHLQPAGFNTQKAHLPYVRCYVGSPVSLESGATALISISQRLLQIQIGFRQPLKNGQERTRLRVCLRRGTGQTDTQT